MGSLNKHDAFNLLDAYYELGGNFIDTAVKAHVSCTRDEGRPVSDLQLCPVQNSYQNEQSEEWIGEWMQARGNRDLIFLATKYEGQPNFPWW